MHHRLRTWIGSTRALDVGIAVVVAAVQVATSLLAAKGQDDREGLDALAIALLIASGAALTFRRRWPDAALLTVFGLTMIYVALDYATGFIWFALIVGLVTALMARRRAVAWGVVVVGYVLFGFVIDETPSLAGALALAAWLLVLLGAGELARARRERSAEQARRRAGEERLAIARELHDLLAHNVSLINVQAGVALHLVDQQPEQARTALAAIKQASAETLRELRAVLGVLRQVDEELPRAPSPSLSRLDDLIERSTATPGVTVRAEVQGEARPLPAGVDLAAYRIVQESLTNVVRHAAPANALVRLTYGERELIVQVADDGSGRGSHSNGAGKGIAGMRERAVALGGELEAGPQPDGGFRVLARFPLEDG